MKKSSKWVPKYMEAYYFIDITMQVLANDYRGLAYEVRMLKNGNMFYNKKDAQAALRRVKLALRG